MSVAAIVMMSFLALLVVFHLALALGAPLGRAAWGGQHGDILPGRFRVASGVVSVAVYPVLILYVASAATLLDVVWLPVGPAGMWLLAGLFVVGAVANFASRSKVERFWGPVSLVLAVCAAIVAIGI